MRVPRLCLIVAMILWCAPVLAQVRERVELSFVEGFESGLPLEVPFLVVGRAPAGIDAIVFSYGPAPGEAPGYLPVAPPQEWSAAFGDRFAFEVWPLHHRKRYRFELRLRSSLRSLARAHPELIDRAVAVLRVRISSSFADGVLDAGDREALAQDLSSVVAGPMEVGLLANAQALPPGEGLDAIVAEAAEAWARREAFAANHAATCEQMVLALAPAGELAGVVAAARAAIVRRPDFGPAAAARWERVLDPRDRNGGTTVAEAAGLLVLLQEEPELLRELLRGTRTIHRDTLLEVEPAAVAPEAEPASRTCPGGGADLASLGILADALRELAGMATADGPWLSADAARAARTAASELRGYRDDAAELRAAEAALGERLGEGLRALTLDTTITFVAAATAVAARTHPYIGMDLGAAWSGELDSALLYTAAHVYAVPVNRGARLGVHRGADVLLKRLSLMLGLAVAGVADDAAGREELSGAGSPMIGIGLRLTRDLRASGGLLWFKQQDPLGGPETTRTTWFTSLSIDLDVAGFVGKLGRLFGG